MPAYKTFASFAEKLDKSLDLIEEGKVKNAVTILKRLQVSAEKRSGAYKDESKGTKKLNSYAQFVKDHFKDVQEDNPYLKASEIMKLLGQKYKERIEVPIRVASKKQNKKKMI